MATIKTLAEAYEFADVRMFERTHLGAIDFALLKDLLVSYGYTDAQITVALANVYEDTCDADSCKAIMVLHQTDNGFEWAYVGYYDCVYEEINICEA